MSDLRDEPEMEVRLRQARRALLASPLLVSTDPAFRIVRAHAEQLRSEFHKELGYELVVRGGHARLRKRTDDLHFDRPARIPRSGHPDTWQPFTRRHYVFFALALAACERSRAQTSIGLLAEEVRSLAAEERVDLDVDQLNDRRCLADVFQYLAWLGVLVRVAGQAEGWVRSRSQDDELLYDVMHSRLDDVIVAPRIIGAEDVTDLLFGGAYPATEAGVNSERKHRVSRRLVEDPVLYLSELSEADRAYYTNPAVRGPRDAGMAEWLGLQAERRREGTGLVDESSEPLSDVRFPVARPWVRQAALLLSERICRRVRAGQTHLLTGDLQDDCRELKAQWGEKLCPADIDADAMCAISLAVLELMRLIRTSDGDVIALPAIARFDEVDMEPAQQRLIDQLALEEL